MCDGLRSGVCSSSSSDPGGECLPGHHVPLRGSGDARVPQLHPQLHDSPGVPHRGLGAPHPAHRRQRGRRRRRPHQAQLCGPAPFSGLTQSEQQQRAGEDPPTAPRSPAPFLLLLRPLPLPREPPPQSGDLPLRSQLRPHGGGVSDDNAEPANRNAPSAFGLFPLEDSKLCLFLPLLGVCSGVFCVSVYFD